MTKSYSFPERVLEDIVAKAIRKGKLFELLFSREGRRLWSSWSEDKVRLMVKRKLSRAD